MPRWCRHSWKYSWVEAERKAFVPSYTETNQASTRLFSVHLLFYRGHSIEVDVFQGQRWWALLAINCFHNRSLFGDKQLVGHCKSYLMSSFEKWLQFGCRNGIFSVMFRALSRKSLNGKLLENLTQCIQTINYMQAERDNFFAAAKQGDVEGVSRFLRSGMDIEGRDLVRS